MENDVKGIVHLATEVVDDVVHFVVTTTEEVDNMLKFELHSAEHCLKAIAMVITQFITKEIDMIIAWLGMLFEWDDILATQKVIAGGILKAINLTSAQIPVWATDADTWMAGLETKAIAAINADLPENVASQQNTTSSMANSGNADANNNSARDSPGANFLNYNIQHGSAGQSLTQPMTSSSASLIQGGDPFQDMVALIQSSFSTIENVFSDIGKNVVDLFEGGSFTPASIHTALNNMFKDVIHDTFQGLIMLVNQGAKLAVDVLASFKAIATQALTINIPLITPLWNSITDGETLNMLNVFALVLALPTTIVTKLLTKAAPSASPAFIQLQEILSQSSTTDADNMNGHKEKKRPKEKTPKTGTSDTKSEKHPDAHSLALAATPAQNGNNEILGDVLSFLEAITAVGIPIMSLVNMVMSILDSTVPPPDEPTSTAVVVFGFAQALLSFPPDFMNPVRPAIEARLILFMLNVASVTAVKFITIKETRAKCIGTIHVVRGICVFVSFMMDLEANSQSVVYPDLDYTMMPLYEINRLIAWGRTTANIISFGARGKNDYALGGYTILNLVCFGVPEVLAGQKIMDHTFVAGAHIPEIDLPI